MYAINMGFVLLIISPRFLRSWKVVRFFNPSTQSCTTVHSVTIKRAY